MYKIELKDASESVDRFGCSSWSIVGLLRLKGART